MGELLHRIEHKDSRQHQPQGIQEDKVKPEVEWVAQLPVLESITVLCQEVEHIPVHLTCGRWKGNVRRRSYSKAFSKSSFEVSVLRMPKFRELKILKSYS